jgi:hypothetical protein
VSRKEETAHLLLPAFARVTGLSCALALLVGYFGPCHVGLRRPGFEGAPAIRMPFGRNQRSLGEDVGRCSKLCDPTGQRMLHDTRAS